MATQVVHSFNLSSIEMSIFDHNVIQMTSQTKITLQDLDDPRIKLLLVNFDRYNEDTIGRIFGLHLSPAELLDLKYEDSQSPEVKLIWRFRHANNNSMVFWNALDPVNQEQLNYHSELIKYTNLLHFFVWLINSRAIEGYRPTQSIVEAFYNDERVNKANLVDQYNGYLGARGTYSDIDNIVNQLNHLVTTYSFPNKSHELIYRAIDELSQVLEALD